MEQTVVKYSLQLSMLNFLYSNLFERGNIESKGGISIWKNNVEIIKADSLVRRRGVNVERHLKRVAAYCRVSSDSEDQKNSYESQVRHYKDYISQRSDWELAGIYADEGISGTQVGKRQDFQRLINDCVNGEIDYIVTKAIARFARNTLNTLKYVRMLNDMQIGVYFEEENIDILTMDGELLLTILSLLHNKK